MVFQHNEQGDKLGEKAVTELIYFVLRYYLPPMIANSSPVLIKGNIPVDKNKTWRDGRRLLGPNKTVEGLITGILSSFIAASCINMVIEAGFSYILLATLAGIAALMGDLAGAFTKRRMDIPPGGHLPVVDQLGFAVAATALYYLLGVEEVVSNPVLVLDTLTLIFVLHVSTNYLAYLLGLKTSKF